MALTFVEQNREVEKLRNLARSKGYVIKYSEGTSQLILVRHDYVIRYYRGSWKVYVVKEKITDTRCESSHPTLLTALKANI